MRKDANYWIEFFGKQPLNRVSFTIEQLNQIINETRKDAHENSYYEVRATVERPDN